MFTAIRRTKSLPAWLALIAAVVVATTLAVVIINSVTQSRTVPVNRVASSAGTTIARTNGASLASPDRAAALTKAQATPALPPAVASSVDAGNASDMHEQAGLTGATSDSFGAMAASDAVGSMPASAGVASSSATAMHRVPSRASVLAHAAARRRAAIERGEGSLRADIARYNAERGAGAQVATPLRSAAVPSLHSLWDDIPGQMSNLYRN